MFWFCHTRLPTLLPPSPPASCLPGIVYFLANLYESFNKLFSSMGQHNLTCYVVKFSQPKMNWRDIEKENISQMSWPVKNSCWINVTGMKMNVGIIMYLMQQITNQNQNQLLRKTRIFARLLRIHTLRIIFKRWWKL